LRVPAARDEHTTSSTHTRKILVEGNTFPNSQVVDRGIHSDYGTLKNPPTFFAFGYQAKISIHLDKNRIPGNIDLMRCPARFLPLILEFIVVYAVGTSTASAVCTFAVGETTRNYTFTIAPINVPRDATPGKVLYTSSQAAQPPTATYAGCSGNDNRLTNGSRAVARFQPIPSLTRPMCPGLAFATSIPSPPRPRFIGAIQMRPRTPATMAGAGAQSGSKSS
jgi:hypothetical protein